MAMFRDSQTAQGFGSLFIGMSSIFAGILVRPQEIYQYWIWAYWLFPLHYVLEGIMTSQFKDDDTPIVASYGSAFYGDVLKSECPDLVDNPNVLYDDIPAECITGTAEQWVYVSFGGMWVPEHIPYDILYLCGAIIVAKGIAWYGLRSKNYLAK